MAGLSGGAPGRFLTLEGGEGSGKTTQAVRLAARLREAGLTVLATREPGGAPGAEQIRRLLVEGEPERWDAVGEALLHCAARRDHVRSTIRPALERGDWVVSDRFADSTMAYQGYGHRLGHELIETLRAITIGPFRPDLTLILDLPTEAAVARLRARAGAEDRYERMPRDFHERVRDGFRAIARREPERCVLVDAGLAPEAVAARLWAAVTERLGVS